MKSEKKSICRDTLYEYAKKYREFSDIVEIVGNLQAKRLLSGGLLNKFNSTIARLMLTKHGYKDQSGVEVQSKGLEEIAASLKELAKND